MIETVTGFLLWNPTLALLPFIGGYLMPWMWHRKARILSTVPALLSWYIGTTAWGAYLQVPDIFSGGVLGLSFALLLAGAGCWFYGYAGFLEMKESLEKNAE